MTNKRAIEMLRNELACVRNTDCERAECKECQLVMPEFEVVEALRMAIKALEQEPLTDKEQRIFLAAMGREEKICREVDEKFPDREPYEDTLVSVCRSIERKVKKTLWE